MAKKKMIPSKKKSLSKKEREEKYRWEMEAYEKEAQRRSAWGWYSQYMSQVRANDEDREYNEAKRRGNTSKVKEIEKKRSSRHNMLVIH